MVKIEKNSFYRRSVLPAGSSIVISPRAKDMALKTSDTSTSTYSLIGGVNATKMVVSGSVPAPLTYGSGDLKGAYYRTFVSGVALSGTASLPIMEAYKIEEGVYPTQGSYEYAYRSGSTSNPQRGNKMFVMTSFLDGDLPWMTENFDGSNVTMGEVSLLGNQGSSTIAMSEAYLELKDAANLIYRGGGAFMGLAESGDVATNLETYFSISRTGLLGRHPETNAGIYGEIGSDKIAVKPLKPSRPEGLWTSSNDRRNGHNIWAVYEPFWKYKDIVSYLKFGKITTSTDDIDAAKEAAEGNTIFNSISVQSPLANLFTGDMENPIGASTAELSTEKQYSGAQSLRLYHFWQVSDLDQLNIMKEREKQMGNRLVNSQVIRASIHNIPEPPPALDMGAFNYQFCTGGSFEQVPVPASGGSANAGTANQYPGLYEGAHLTDKRLSFPEINMTMNITKLFPSPQIEVASTEGNAIWGDGTIYGWPAMAGTDATYQAGQHETDRLFYGAFNNAAAATTASTASGANIWKYSQGGLNTLLRSVCVTFSNYKPDAYTSLEEFLAASLDDAYWLLGSGTGSQSNYKADTPWNLDMSKAKLACGVLFQSFRGSSEYNIGLNTAGDGPAEFEKDQDVNPDSIYAMALPMSMYANMNAAHPVAGPNFKQGLYCSGGFAKFDNAGITMSGTSAASGGAMTLVHDARVGLMNLVGPSGGTSTGSQLPAFNEDGSAGKPWGDSGSTAEPLWVEIDKDSWFTLKFVFDAQSRFGQSKGGPGQSGSLNSNPYNPTKGGTPGGPAAASGGSYTYSVGSGSSTGKASDGGEGNTGIDDYGLADPNAQFGVPLRCYISGAKGNSNWGLGEGRDTTSATANIPYLNLPLPFRGATILSGSEHFQDATCDTTGNTTVTMDSTTLVSVGDTISGSGIVADTTVASVDSATQLTISQAADDTASNVTLSFSDASAGWLKSANNFIRGNAAYVDEDTPNPPVVIQQNSLECVGENYPFKYMTIWVNNYRWTKYEDYDATATNNDYSFWRGNWFDSDYSTTNSAPDTAYTGAKYRAADSKLFPNGTSMEAEVFIDNIEFKYWNNEHINNSIEAGSLNRFLKMEPSSILSPAQTFWNSGTVYNDDSDAATTSPSDGYNLVASGATDRVNSMMKGLNASGTFRPVNPGYFISLGVDDPADLPLTFVSGSLGDGLEFDSGFGGQTNMRSGYFLFNNFQMTGDFASLQRLAPDIAFVSTSPAGKPENDVQDEVGNEKGVVPYNTSMTRNLGTQVAGRNFAMYNPAIKGIYGGGTSARFDEVETYLRNKQSPNMASGAAVGGTSLSPTNIPDQMRYTNKVTSMPTNNGAGWVIDSHGSLYAKNTDNFPQRYSNTAHWAGVGGLSAGSFSYDYYGNDLLNVSGTFFTGEDPHGATGSVTKTYQGFNWVPVVSGTTQASGYALGSGAAINMGTGSTGTWLSTDGFTQKGFVKIDIDTKSNTGSTVVGDSTGESWHEWSKFAPRENILCAAKILAVPGSVPLGAIGSRIEPVEDNATIIVDDTSIFNVKGDDRYVIFQMNAEENAWDMLPNSDNFTPSLGGAVPAVFLSGGTSGSPTTGNCSGALGYHTQVKLSNVNPITDTSVTLTVTDDVGGTLKERIDGVFRADDGTTLLCTEKNVHNLWISPLKYWINLGFFENPNTGPKLSRSYESVVGINTVTQAGSSANKAPGDGGNDAQGVATDNTISGSTYNEFEYAYNTALEGNKGEAGLIANPWILDAVKEDTTSLALQDYGYGGFNEGDGTGGQLGIKTAWKHRVNYTNIDGLITGNRSVNAPDDTFAIVLGLSDLHASKQITMYTDNYTDATVSDIYKPAFIWEYHDNLPKVTNFKVTPTFEALNKDVNLYDLTTEDLNSVDFTWNESSDGDIWYRMLMIDTVPIANKYHKAKFWLPLNEIPSDNGGSAGTDLTTGTTHVWYSDNSSSLGETSGNCLSGAAVLQTIDGLSGYAPLFADAVNSDSDKMLVVSANDGFVGLDEWTLVIHGRTLDNTNKAGGAVLFYQSGASDDKVSVRIDAGGDFKVLMDGGGGEATLQSTSICAFDGETPFNLIVTYKSGSAVANQGPDLQMFVNGRREDYVVTGSGSLSSDANLLIGGLGGSLQNFVGWLEEVILYEKRYEVVETENKYTYSTADLSTPGTPYTMDVRSGGKFIPHNAKLFLFDYHNIRGKDATQVCSTNQFSWRTTA